MAHANWYLEDQPPSWCFRDHDWYFYQHNNHGWCEGKAYPHQWANCFSSIFVLAMAFWQLTWDHNVNILRFLSSSFAVNAVCSFLNHWYGTRQWKVMDTSSRYVEIWVIATAIWDVTYSEQRLLFNQHRNKTENTQTTDTGRPFIRGVLWTLCAFVIWALLLHDIAGCEIDSNPGKLTAFLIYSGIPLLSMAVNWLFFVYEGTKTHTVEKVVTELEWVTGEQGAFRRSARYMGLGVLVIIICGVIRTAGELPCDDWPWLAYVPAHAIWHMGSAYGLSLVGMWFVCVNSVLEEHYYAFKTDEQRLIRCCCPIKPADKCNKCCQKVFPIVTNFEHEQRKPYEKGDIDCCQFCCKQIADDCGKGNSEEDDDVANQGNESVALEVKQTNDDKDPIDIE
eukprot:602748_1